MNVQSSARRRALLGLYASHRKVRGSRITLRQLEIEWRQTGLRRFDLQLALKDLEQRRWLTRIDRDGPPHYELTYLGECAMHSIRAGGALGLVNDWLTLRHAKQRVLHQMPSPPQLHQRRASDRLRIPELLGTV